MSATNKIIVTGTAETPVYTQSARSLTDNLVGALTSPLDAFKDSNEYVNKADAAQQTLAGAVAGFVAGDMFGGRVPVLGGRR